MTETLPQLSFASPSPWCKPTDATRRRCSAGVLATASPAAGGHARRGRPRHRASRGGRRRRCARRAGGAASGWQRDAVHTGAMGNAVAPNQWLSRPPPVAGGHARRGRPRHRASRGGRRRRCARRRSFLMSVEQRCSRLPEGRADMKNSLRKVHRRASISGMGTARHRLIDRGGPRGDVRQPAASQRVQDGHAGRWSSCLRKHVGEYGHNRAPRAGTRSTAPDAAKGQPQGNCAARFERMHSPRLNPGSS